MSSREDVGSSDPDPGFERVIRLIEDEVDFEPGYYNDAYLRRRITARMRRCDAETYDEYLGELRGSEEERDALLDSLTINVTQFFRNPVMWSLLRPVLRTLSAERRRIRLWSAPCADGREPYSLAILASDDPEVDERRVAITATDIDSSALEAARRGVYRTTRTTDIADELAPIVDIGPYVERDGDTFRVRNRLKRMISFERHDLISDGAKSGYDLVLCRNLLIYIDSGYKLPIFETITDSIRDGGYLVIGMTESLPISLRGDFEPVDKRHRIYRKLES